MEYEYREEIIDGVRTITPYVASKPMSAAEAFSDDRPLPDRALWILGWGPYAGRETTEYDYRIVLEQPNGETLPLVPQSSLEGARERLQDILDDPQTTYPRGWLERRPSDTWETFRAAQLPRRNAWDPTKGM